MNTKAYVAMAALAAMALMVGAFALPATVPVAYADNNSIHTHNNIHTKQTCKVDNNGMFAGAFSEYCVAS